MAELDFPFSLCRTGKLSDVDDENYIFEYKMDGERCLLYRLRSGQCYLRNRRGNFKTRNFVEVINDFKNVNADRFVIDGEVIIPTEDKPYGDFNKILERNTDDDFKIKVMSTTYPCLFVAFDILLYNSGLVLRDKPLIERKEILRKNFSPSKHFTIANEDKKDYIWSKVVENNIEGLIAKRKNSRYYSGRSRNWLKIKNTGEDIVTFTGYKVNPQGITLTNEDGIRVLCAGKQSIEVKNKIDAMGEASAEICYLEKNNGKYRQPTFKRLVQ